MTIDLFKVNVICSCNDGIVALKTFFEQCLIEHSIVSTSPTVMGDTVKPETLRSGNFDEFSKSGSNHQTLTFQVKTQSKISVHYKTKVCAFTSILSMFLLSKFFESAFTKV